MWSLQELLDQVQDLINQPRDAFYNITDRTKRINQAQNILVRDTESILDVAETTLNPLEFAVLKPNDFINLAPEKPKFEPLPFGKTTHLEVYTVRQADAWYPGWQHDLDNSVNAGTPKVLVETPLGFSLYPATSVGGKVILPYVKTPTPMADPGDLPFNADPQLQEFAEAIPLKVAAGLLLSTAPQLSQLYLGLYNELLRQMRHKVKQSPHIHTYMRPNKVLNWQKRR